jgi:very-short-patch-repair endonuclease
MAYEPTFPRDTARRLRANATEAEQKLWSQLRKRQLYGFQFRRQYSIAPFFVDFICLEARLIIEVDGAQHADQKEQDQSRSEFLHTSGYHVLRFWNFEVLSHVDSVVERIAEVLRQTMRRGEQDR